VPTYDGAGQLAGLRYQYALKDHLGNVRALVEPAGQPGGHAETNLYGDTRLVQAQSYYPYGMRHGDLTEENASGEEDPSRLAYNGKERVGAFGLDWHHYGARYYDTQLAVWTTMDPADEFHSPYVYVGADPVNLIDPDGRQAAAPGCDGNGPTVCNTTYDILTADYGWNPSTAGMALGAGQALIGAGQGISSGTLGRGPMRAGPWMQNARRSGRYFSWEVSKAYDDYIGNFGSNWRSTSMLMRGLGTGLTFAEASLTAGTVITSLESGNYRRATTETAGFLGALYLGAKGAVVGVKAAAPCGPSAGYCGMVTVPAFGVSFGLLGKEGASAAMGGIYDAGETLVRAFTDPVPIPSYDRGLAPADATYVRQKMPIPEGN
jgi:RHS repeat-associated protein